MEIVLLFQRMSNPLPYQERLATRDWCRVLFENRPILYFCNYIFITEYKLYIFFLFRIKDTV